MFKILIYVSNTFIFKVLFFQQAINKYYVNKLQKYFNNLLLKQKVKNPKSKIIKPKSKKKFVIKKIKILKIYYKKL